MSSAITAAASVDVSVAEQLMALAHDAMVVMDAAGVITGANPATARLTGLPVSALIGQDWRAALPLAGDDASRAALSELCGTVLSRQRATLVRRDGASRELEVSLAPMLPPAAGWLLVLTDLTRQDAGEAPITASNQFALMAINEIPAAVAVVELASGEFNLVYQNAYGEELTGWANGARARDPNFSMTLVHPDDLEAALALKTEIHQSARAFSHEYRQRQPDGTYHWLRESVRMITDDNSQPAYLVGFVVDVSDLKETETALRQAMADLQASNAELSRANAAKSEYLGIMSHEFRTPLTSIQGFSELIAGGDLTIEDTVQFAELIGNSSQRLSRLINDMLNLDRLEAGRTPLHRRLISLPRLIGEVLTGLTPLIGHHLVQVYPETDLPEISVDPDLLTQVLTNVIANAIKYSPAGATVTISAGRDPAAPEEAIIISVRDTGPGIPFDALESIFSRFARLDRTAEQGVAGSGLGLPIARQIVERHQGQIWAESQPGAGATFFIRLPRMATAGD